jgi:hypothetical protein
MRQGMLEAAAGTMGEIGYGGDGNERDVNLSYSGDEDTGIGGTELFLER